MTPFSLYIHIPYCFHKCPYCDFNSYAVTQAPEEDYVRALLSELDYRAQQNEWVGRKVKTIFFGGGTPSLFAPRSIKSIIDFVCRTFPVDGSVEITLEANPGTVTIENLIGYRSAGINRISFGAQSFSPQVLKSLGRVHSPQDTDMAVVHAREAGFSNISLDLIHGVPGQSIAEFGRDLRHILDLEPEHISSYGLTFEKGTEFYAQYKKGRLVPPSDDNLVAMYEEQIRVFLQAGFLHYEVSNFALPGREAKHNLNYWAGHDYLGLGAGAHSMVNMSAGKRIRWCNVALPATYIERASAFGYADSWSDTLGVKEIMFEFFFLGLRRAEGVNLSSFKSQFGFTVESAYPGIVEVLTQGNFLEIDQGQLHLTKKGLLVADSVISNFIYDKEILPQADSSIDHGKQRSSQRPLLAANV